MLDAKNVVVITGNLTRDPETVNNNLIKFGLAVDYAGSGGTTGFFDIVYWVNDAEKGSNSAFVTRQVSEGKMKKGSSVQVVGRLFHERWETPDGDKRSRVTIVAESLTYASTRSATGGTDDESSDAPQIPVAAAAPEF